MCPRVTSGSVFLEAEGEREFREPLLLCARYRDCRDVVETARGDDSRFRCFTNTIIPATRITIIVLGTTAAIIIKLLFDSVVKVE